MTRTLFKGGGFQDGDHRRSFETARARVRFGGPEQRRCGAHTRLGHRCAKTPLAGEIRCLAHGGPAAARRYREAQLDALRRGEMTLEDFAKAERKRANNRLRDLWKYQPWIPGSTLDLGEHEGAFSRDLGFCGLDIDALPPSVADTARWRWRRLCLDRARHEAWASSAGRNFWTAFGALVPVRMTRAACRSAPRRRPFEPMRGWARHPNAAC